MPADLDFNGFVELETQFNAFFSPWAGNGTWMYFFGAGGNLGFGDGLLTWVERSSIDTLTGVDSFTVA